MDKVVYLRTANLGGFKFTFLHSS